MRWAAYAVLALLLLVQWPLWFGKGGWLRVWELQRAVAAQREVNAQIAARNGVLAAEVRSLQEGREAIEERARHELHMTRSGEILFQLVAPSADPRRSLPQPNVSPSAPSSPEQASAESAVPR
jgi:cell division protein FtsB